MLPDFDQELLEQTLNTELQFNPNYYRIHTPQEIEEAERAIEEQKQMQE